MTANSIGRYGKCINGSIIAALSAATVAEQTPGITQAEWITIAIAFLTTLGAVFATSNTAPPKPYLPPQQPAVVP